MTDLTQRARELLPCPFCGSEGKMVEVEPSGYVVECQNGICAASTNIRYSCGDDARPLVIEQWNRRAALSSPQAAAEPMCGCGAADDEPHLPECAKQPAQADGLPELPEAKMLTAMGRDAYSADQMRTYGQQCRSARVDLSKLREAVDLLASFRVFIVSREKAKQPEGPDLFDECIARLRSALIDGRQSAGAVVVDDAMVQRALGPLPAELTNPEAWPENYADGFNEAMRMVVEFLPTSLRAALGDGMEGA